MGDRNSKLFHKHANTRQISAHINCLKVNDEITIDLRAILSHVNSFYMDLFKNPGHIRPPI